MRSFYTLPDSLENMKRISAQALLLLTCAFCLSTTSSHGQENISRSHPFDLHAGTSFLSVLHADSTGVVIEEHHYTDKYIPLTATKGTMSGALIELGPSLDGIFNKDFDQELKGKNILRFLFIRNRLYLFASSPPGSDTQGHLYAAEVDRSSGLLLTDWRVLDTCDLSAAYSNVEYNIRLNSDSSRIVLAKIYFDGTRFLTDIRLADENLRYAGEPLLITSSTDYSLSGSQRYIFSYPDRTILIGADPGIIRMYDKDGKLQEQIVMNTRGNFINGFGLCRLNNELELLACTSKAFDGKINGLILESMNASMDTGVRISNLPFNNLGHTGIKDTSNGLDPHLVFRNAFATPDSGLLILAEQYQANVTSLDFKVSRRSDPVTKYSEHFISGDLYMIKINARGTLDWMNIVPRKQEEIIGPEAHVIVSGGGNPFLKTRPFAPAPPIYPYYSGFGCIVGSDHQLHIFFNDNKKNQDVLGPNQKVKEEGGSFSGSVCYQLTLDMRTGKFSRKIVFENAGKPAAMPRLAMAIDGLLFMPCMDEGSAPAGALVKIVPGH